jgi:hypothetical protein
MRTHKVQPSLIIIISLFLLTLLSSCRANLQFGSDSHLKVFQEKNFNIEPGKLLKMKVSSADVVIKTWDKPEIYVKVSGNKKAIKKADIEYNKNENMLEIRSDNEDHFNFFSKGLFMKFEIFVPDNFNTDIRTSGGIISVTKLAGDFSLKTSGGDIILKDLNGPINAKTSGGTISGNNINGDARIATSGGDINYENFKGELLASTSGGTINLNGKDSKINANTSGGDINLVYSGINKGIKLDTSGGTITIKVPADFNASMKLRTSGGSIDSGLKINKLEQVTSHRLEGDLNSGGNTLMATTSGGDIRVTEKK